MGGLWGCQCWHKELAYFSYYLVTGILHVLDFILSSTTKLTLIEAISRVSPGSKTLLP